MTLINIEIKTLELIKKLLINYNKWGSKSNNNRLLKNNNWRLRNYRDKDNYMKKWKVMAKKLLISLTNKNKKMK